MLKVKKIKSTNSLPRTDQLYRTNFDLQPNKKKGKRMLTRNQERCEREMQDTYVAEYKKFTETVKGYLCLVEKMRLPDCHEKNKAEKKLETVYVLFNYIMLEKTQKIISAPDCERLRQVLLNKVKQLKVEVNTETTWVGYYNPEVNTHTTWEGYYNTELKKTFPNHHKLKYRLLSTLNEAEEFLSGRSQTNDSSESLCLRRSDRVKNKIVAEFDKKLSTLAPPKRIIVKVLPRRSARLMAKNA